MEAPGPRTGTRFGPYELRSLLGKGGMGEVYEAYDTVKDRVVAVKLLHEELAGDPAYQVRFRRESQAAARVAEPHIVPIHDWGVIDGVLFIDMQLVPGVDLRTLLRTEGALSPVRAVGIIEQIASALDAAHAGGLVHRDVKPANILVTAADHAYLADFGIAHTEGDSAVTVVGMAVGSYIYMAPERFDVGQVTGRADIYSLSCVLHECLTGASPFPAASMNVLIRSHLSETPPRPSAQQAGIPAGLDAVISRGMAKNPADRWPTAAALALAARAALSSPPPTGTAEMPATEVPADAPAPTVPPPTGPMLVVRAPGAVPPESTGEISAVILPGAPTVVRPTEIQFTTLSGPQEPAAPFGPAPRWTPEQALPPVRPFPDAHLYSEESGGQTYSEQSGAQPYPDRPVGQPYPDPIKGQPYSDRRGGQPYPDQPGERYPDQPGGQRYPEVDKPFSAQSGGSPYPDPRGARPYSDEPGGPSYSDSPGGLPYPDSRGGPLYSDQPGGPYPDPRNGQPYSAQPGGSYPDSRGEQPYSDEPEPPYAGRPGAQPYPDQPTAFIEHPGAQAYSQSEPYAGGQAYSDPQRYETTKFADPQGFPPPADDYPPDQSATQAYSAPDGYRAPEAYSEPDEYYGAGGYSAHGGHARPDYPPPSNYAAQREYAEPGYADDYDDYEPEADSYAPTGKRRSVVLPILIGVVVIVVIAVVGAIGWQVFTSRNVAPPTDQQAGAPVPTASAQPPAPGSSSPPPVASTPAKPTTVTLPAGAKPCTQGGSTTGSFTKSATGSAATTCAFAEEVRRAYAESNTASTASRESSRSVVATSPVTGRTYTMNCLSEGQLVTCSGGENAVVYVY
ncbi:protein kinase [Nocardia sp. NPDC057030]|uniref:protein kinase domain-containing protein n=1 Tax=unclassified Nocardia TaxID=2637762 RepID=UPI00362CA06A